MNQWIVRPLETHDRASWQSLFQGYADFYDKPLAAEIVDTAWHWLNDSNHPLIARLVARDDEPPVGFAHVRACPHTLSGRSIGFLDDLFVAESARGWGAADALFEALRDLAITHEWPAVRWATQYFNHRGRRFYDRYTDGPSDFIQYHWAMS